jgi:hypothetical protein
VGSGGHVGHVWEGREGVKLQLKAINKLPSQDPQGAVPGIILIVLLIGGYLGATFAMLRTKTTATHHRVTALFGYAVLLGLVIDLIAGPILGGYPDVWSHFWVLWPIFAFIAFAVALLATTLQSLVGRTGLYDKSAVLFGLWEARSAARQRGPAGHRGRPVRRLTAPRLGTSLAASTMAWPQTRKPSRRSGLRPLSAIDLACTGRKRRP